MTVEQYHDHENEYQGICIKCKAVKDECEPDAREYEYDECGENSVYGVPELLMMGLIRIVD